MGGHQEEFDYLIKDVCMRDCYGFKRLPFKPDCLVDIGANNGYTSIWFNYCFPEAKIFAIEPNSKTFERLVYNTKNLPIICIQKGIGDGRTLHLQGFDGTSRAFYSDEIGSESIETITLPNIIGNLSGSYYLKVDAEGGEKFLLHDNNLPYLRNADFIGMEYHPTDRITPEEATQIHNVIKETHTILRKTWELDKCGLELSVHNKYLGTH